MGVPPRVLLTIGCVIVLLTAAAMAQRSREAAPALPPLSMTCPHHPDVVETSPGSCPFCKMALVPVRLAPAWTCPIHASTIADKAGTCPICRRQLVPVTVSLTWICPGSTEEHLAPGTCANGVPMTARRTLRPHGDHNPRHGGQFFMAADSWHHVEGTYPSARVFRLYVYDDFSRPLAAGRLRAVKARVVTRERFDPATRKTTELSVFPLRVSANGAYLEARVDAATLPATMTAKVQFTAEGQEQRFDFTFPALTRSPAPAAAPPRAASAPSPASTRTTARPAPVVPATAPATAPAAAPDVTPEPDPALVTLPVPSTVPEILEQLRARTRQIGDLITRGDFGAVWVPAFQAKDLAIALEGRLASLDPSQRETAAPALQRLVRMSWLLDAHGDTGNRDNVAGAYEAFRTAAGDVVSIFETVK
ncbi:MAG TPA: heavy metal-binding domain-containing protein [Vicinamibacterales bacterium]|nr:heavy metal-binding domain-containing protein [Vicinamibacterales bacterium]